MRLLSLCRDLGIEEASVYGFTRENVRRPVDQVQAFRQACVDFCRCAAEVGTALHVIGDSDSSVFPEELRRYTVGRTTGDIQDVTLGG